MKQYFKHLLLLAGAFLTLQGFTQTYIQITAYQPPPLQISELVDQDILEGNTATLGGDEIVTGGYGGYSYEWQPTEMLDLDTIPRPIASPQTTTVYTLIISSEDFAFT